MGKEKRRWTPEDYRRVGEKLTLDAATRALLHADYLERLKRGPRAAIAVWLDNLFLSDDDKKEVRGAYNELADRLFDPVATTDPGALTRNYELLEKVMKACQLSGTVLGRVVAQTLHKEVKKETARFPREPRKRQPQRGPLIRAITPRRL
jgi:hypothetical protein